MAKAKYHIVRFQAGEPRWAVADGTALTPCDAPADTGRLPLVVLIPDELLFFFKPQGVVAKGDRNLRAAVQLQQRHFFPELEPGQERGTLSGPGGTMLGWSGHPDLQAFWEKHGTLLDRAGTVTSAFLLAWAAAQAEGLGAWLWRGESGENAPCALAAGDVLYYSTGCERELAARMAELNLDREPEAMGLGRSLDVLSGRGVKLSRLRLPFGNVGGGSGFDARVWMRAIVALSVLGLLFSAGEAVRWMGVSSQAATWEQAIQEQYRQALGKELGQDPYGRLLFRLDQLKGSQSSGVDVLELLAAISRVAPDRFVLESMNLNEEQGSIRARIANYNQLEKMLADLEKVEEYTFTLEQASNTQQGVSLGLKVTMVGR